MFTTNNVFNRRSREYYWQLRLGTIFPKGLNNYPVNISDSTTSSPFKNNIFLETINNVTITDSELLETLCFLYNN